MRKSVLCIFAALCAVTALPVDQPVPVVDSPIVLVESKPASEAVAAVGQDAQEEQVAPLVATKVESAPVEDQVIPESSDLKTDATIWGTWGWGYRRPYWGWGGGWGGRSWGWGYRRPYWGWGGYWY